MILKIFMLVSTAGFAFCVYLFTQGTSAPPAAIFLALLFILFAMAQERNFIHRTECCISPEDEGFDDPNRKLLVKFDYRRMGHDYVSRKYLRRLKWGAGTCAACKKNIREQTKTKG